MSWSRSDVTFYSDGLKLSAYLYIPEDYKKGEKRAGIVCCHGYSGMKDAYLLPVPERLVEKGYVALTFDHRGFGKSEGMRARNIPREQVADVRNAMTYLQQQPQVDPNRMGLYGTSFGGGNVTFAGAIDERAKAIVSVGGIGNGKRVLKATRRHWEWLALLETLEEDRIRRVLTGEARRVDLSEMLPADPYSIEAQKKIGSAEVYTGGYPWQNAEDMIEYCPEEVAHKISPRAICFVHTAGDAFVPAEESITMFEKAGEPKKLVLIPGARHYDAYKFVNPEVFEKVMEETVGWYGKYL